MISWCRRRNTTWDKRIRGRDLPIIYHRWRYAILSSECVQLFNFATSKSSDKLDLTPSRWCVNSEYDLVVVMPDDEHQITLVIYDIRQPRTKQVSKWGGGLYYLFNQDQIVLDARLFDPDLPSCNVHAKKKWPITTGDDKVDLPALKGMLFHLLFLFL